jgi:hypothetical protein
VKPKIFFDPDRRLWICAGQIGSRGMAHYAARTPALAYWTWLNIGWPLCRSIH